MNRDRDGGATGDTKGALGLLVNLAAILVGVAAVISVGFLIRNELTKNTPSHTRLDANVANVEVYPDRTLRVFLDSHPDQLARFREKARAEGLSRREIAQVLETQGILAEFAIATTGAQDQDLTLTHILYDARTEARIPEGPVQVLIPERYVSPTESFESTQVVWQQDPALHGTYFLEVDVVGPRQETLTTRRSRPFHA
jgi:hypothetical protein